MAAPQARRLELTLAVKADTAGAKAGMDQLAAAADKAQKAMSKAQKEAEAAQQKAIRAARIARDTASGAIAGVYDRETGKTTYRRGAGSRFGDAIFGTPAVDATTGVIGKPTGGLLANVGSRFGITPGMAGPAAAAAVAYQAAVTSKAVIDSNRDELLTADQRARQVFKSVPFGDTVLGFAGTVTGRDRDMARAQEQGQLNAVRSSAESQIYTTQLSLRGGVAQSQAQANALRGAQAERTPNIDRTSAEGERRYRLESQITALKERGATAGRAASAAREEEGDAAKAIKDIDQKMLANRQRQAEIQRALDRQAGGQRSVGGRIVGALAGGFTGAFLPEALDLTGPARKRYLDEQAWLQEQLTALTGNKTTEQQRQAGAAQRKIQAKADQQRALGPEQMRARAAALEEKAGRALSASERIGLSTPESAEEGYAALQNIVAGGIDNADPTEIAAAQRYAPETVARLAREAGRRNPMYDAFRQLADPGEYPAESAGSLFGQANALKNQAGQSDLNIQAQAAERGAAMAAATMDAYIAALRANIPNLIERAKNEILQGRSASAGSQ